MKILQTLSTWISDKWTRKNKHPPIEIGDYWKRSDFTHPRRINGVTNLWGRTLKISFQNSDIVLDYSYFIEHYEYYKKSDDKRRRVINTGEMQSTEIPTFSGMPSVAGVVLKTTVPYIATVVVIASVAGLTVGLHALLTWIKS